MQSLFNPEDARFLFADWPGKWFVAGGWAIDLFLDKETRDHGDLDIMIFRKDIASVRNYLSSWESCVGLGEGKFQEKLLSSHENMPEDRSVLWMRQNSESPWAFELIFNNSVGDQWIFKRDESIKRDINTISTVTKNGIPYLQPEIVLLHKAKSLKEKDIKDFENTYPHLSKHSQIWLRDAIQKVHPDHPWLERMRT